MLDRSEPIATRLESYRQAHGLTQRQMADRLGVSWRTYRGWINRPTGGPAVPLLERLLDEWERRVHRGRVHTSASALVPVPPGRECMDCGEPRWGEFSRCLKCALQYGVKLGGTG